MKRETLDRVRSARKDATGKRGRYAGHLRRNCPPMGTDASIFWQSAMLACNPHKVSLGQLMFLTTDQSAFKDCCDVYLENLHSVELANLDLDAAQLRSLGVY